MARTYTKLFQSILDSTIWQETLAVKVVWVTMLAMVDEDGRVWAAVPGLARRAGVTVKDCEEALAKFEAPDPYSRTKDNEGKRVVVIEGGWQLLNHGKYRAMMNAEERREYQRIKQAEYRARTKKAPASGREQRFEKAVRDGNEAEADKIAAEGLPGNGE